MSSWKFTELREEINRLGLPTIPRSLESELIRSLERSLRLEQEESARINSSTVFAPENANKDSEMFPATEGDMAPNRKRIFRKDLIEAALRSLSTPVATEASSAVETRLSPVFSGKDINPLPFTSVEDETDDDVMEDMAGFVSSMLASDASVVAEDKEPVSGLNGEDSKAQPTEELLEKSAMSSSSSFSSQ